MDKITKLIQKAYIPSASEYDELWGKFRAFVPANRLEKAKENGAIDYYFTRSAYRGYYGNAKLVYADNRGFRTRTVGFSSNIGLRIAFNLMYNPDNTLVEGCRNESRTTTVMGNDDQTPYDDHLVQSFVKKEVTSTAPIIHLASGINCIWLNKAQCENGKAKTMQLWTLDIVDCAVPFSENDEHNDWGKATELQKQCEDWIEENLTTAEKKMLIPVEMSSEDDYEKATPILEQEQPKWEEIEQ